MKKILFLLMVVTGTTGCNGQQAKDSRQQDEVTKKTTEQNIPKVNWHVNKKYDDKGNLIGYDSTYTWSYSSHGKVQQISADSVLKSFRREFDAEFPAFFNHSFGDPVWNDSLFFKDFTAPDYFMRKWNEHYFDMRNMMQRMDSLRNSFLDKHYPGLDDREEKRVAPIKKG